MVEVPTMAERKARRLGVQSDQFSYEDRGKVDVAHVLETALNEVAW